MIGTDQYRRPRLLAGLDVGLSRPRDARVGLLQQAAIRCGTRSRATSAGMRRRPACASATVAGVICHEACPSGGKHLSGTDCLGEPCSGGLPRTHTYSVGCGSMGTPGRLRGTSWRPVSYQPGAGHCRPLVPSGATRRTVPLRACSWRHRECAPDDAHLYRREFALGAIESALSMMHTCSVERSLLAPSRGRS